MFLDSLVEFRGMTCLLSIINVTRLDQFREKLSCILPPLASLELLAAVYLCETNISKFVYHLLMVTCSIDALKNSSKRKEMRVKKEKVEVLQQIIYSRKETGK